MPGWLLTLLLAYTADAATTHVGLASGRKVEVLLPTQNPWAADAMIMGQAAMSAATIKFVRDKGHPHMAKGLLVGLVAVRGAAVVVNVTF